MAIKSSSDSRTSRDRPQGIGVNGWKKKRFYSLERECSTMSEIDSVFLLMCTVKHPILSTVYN